MVARNEVVPCLGNACCVYSEEEEKEEGRVGIEGEKEKEGRR